MTLQPGQTLRGGQYRIEKVLGEGGFGVTYWALNQNLNKRVVIKTPNDTLCKDPQYPEFVKRFIDEARILARLADQRHPHIVQVSDLFEEDKLRLWCMVMECIEGSDLGDQVMQQGPLPEAEALRYIQQIGDALTVVHREGLLHRDIKPHNIMVRSRTTDAVLIDFGTARGFTPNITQTHTQFLTEGYAPIEQYDQRAQRGAFTDVYALAATLYVLVTGQIPVDARTRKLNWVDYRNDPLELPQHVKPGLSEQVSHAILRGMAIEPKDRPQTMPDWLALLPGGIAQGQAAPKPPSPTPVAPAPSLRSAIPTQQVAPAGPPPSVKATQTSPVQNPQPVQLRSHSQGFPWITMTTYLVLYAGGLLGLLILGFLGYVGWRFWTVSPQKQVISDAQSLMAGAIDVDKVTSLSELQSAQRKLKNNETVLAAVPNIPGSAYAEAQAALIQVRKRLRQVEERLQAEAKAQESLTTAMALATEATNLVKRPDPTIESWKEAEAKWLDAISSLATVPPTSFLYPEASQRIEAYRNNYLLARKEVMDLGGEVQPISELGGSPEAFGR